MTWGAMIWKIVSDPLAIMFALIVGGLCGFGGYLYGQHIEHVSNEAEKQTAIVQQFEAVRPKEAEAATNVNKASKDHETTKASNKTNAAVISSNFTGLRVRAACNDKPTIAAAPGKLDATAESGPSGLERAKQILTELREKLSNLGTITTTP